ncbi:MAG: class I SAM-dependent methyltransferase [Blastocatellia bacterium]
MSCEINDVAYQQSALALSEDILRRYVPENGLVIDIGCGTGRWCRATARYAAKVTGIDLDSVNTRTAQALSEEKILSTELLILLMISQIPDLMSAS